MPNSYIESLLENIQDILNEQSNEILDVKRQIKNLEVKVKRFEKHFCQCPDCIK